MANIGTAEAAAFIPEIWANLALGRLRENIAMAKLVARDTDVGAFRVGDILHLPKRGSLSVNDKAADTAVTLQTPTSTTVDVTLNKHKEVSFLIEDVASAQANQPVMSGYVEDAVIALAEQIDDDLIALYSGLSASVGTSGTDLTEATLLSARKTLTDNKCPLVGRNLVIATKDEKALLALARITEADKRGGGDQIGDGSIGRVHGFNVFVSQNVPVVSGSPNSTKNLAFHRNAFIAAFRALPAPPAGSGVESTIVADPMTGVVLRLLYGYNMDHLGMQCTLDVLYGVAEMRDEYGCVVLS